MTTFRLSAVFLMAVFVTGIAVSRGEAERTLKPLAQPDARGSDSVAGR